MTRIKDRPRSECAKVDAPLLPLFDRKQHQPVGEPAASLVAPCAQNISESLEEALQKLFAHGTLKTFPDHTVIITEGESTDSVYLIRSGSVKVFLRGKNGNKVDITVLEAGDFFGEMVLDGRPRSASVATMGPSRLSIIPQSVFREFVACNPDFAMQVILKLIPRTRRLLQNVKSLALLDVYGRVARTLLELATPDDDDLVIKERPSAQDIAHLIGTSRESVSRVLRDLAARGYILVHGKSMTIAKNLPQHR